MTPVFARHSPTMSSSGECNQMKISELRQILSFAQVRLDENVEVNAHIKTDKHPDSYFDIKSLDYDSYAHTVTIQLSEESE